MRPPSGGHIQVTLAVADPGVQPGPGLVGLALHPAHVLAQHLHHLQAVTTSPGGHLVEGRPLGGVGLPALPQ